MVDPGTLDDNEKRVAELLGREWGLLIDGKVGPAQSGRRFDVWAPSTGARIAQVPDAGAADAERAVTSARNAFPGWRSTTAIERAQVMERFAQAIEARAQDLALLDSIDGGTPIRVTTGDVVAAVMLLRYFAGLVTEIKGVTVPSSANLHFTERVPYGVVVRIIPFNHPLMFAVKQLSAPLLTGNTLVLKPAEATPLSALLLGEIAQDILPPGVLNIIVGDGPEASSALVSHPAVHRIGFTGSDATGVKVVQAAAATGFKEVSLELGGKNALIAFPDADPAEVAAGVVAGMNFTWSGQSCGSTSRLLVHEDIADATVDAVLDRLGNHVVANPLDPKADQGTLVNERQYQKVLDYIEIAVAEGARVVHGGGPSTRSRGGSIHRADSAGRCRSLFPGRSRGDFRTGTFGDPVEGPTGRHRYRQQRAIRINGERVYQRYPQSAPSRPPVGSRRGLDKRCWKSLPGITVRWIQVIRKRSRGKPRRAAELHPNQVDHRLFELNEITKLLTITYHHMNFGVVCSNRRR